MASYLFYDILIAALKKYAADNLPVFSEDGTFKKGIFLFMNKRIVFNSNTGNTRMLAETIDLALGENTQEILFVGFWTDKGTADAKTIDFLKSCQNKKIFLFGTCGFGGSTEYFEQIIERVKANLDATNEVIGWYMCQGKMPQTVRARYTAMKDSTNCPPNIDQLIENFDKALSHPDTEDLENLSIVVKKIG